MMLISESTLFNKVLSLCSRFSLLQYFEMMLNTAKTTRGKLRSISIHTLLSPLSSEIKLGQRIRLSSGRLSKFGVFLGSPVCCSPTYDRLQGLLDAKTLCNLNKYRLSFYEHISDDAHSVLQEIILDGSQCFIFMAMCVIIQINKRLKSVIR